MSAFRVDGPSGFGIVGRVRAVVWPPSKWRSVPGVEYP